MKKISFFLLFQIVMFAVITAQQNPTDSLIQVAKKSSNDSIKIAVYDQIAKMNAASDNEKALFFGQKSLDLSVKTKNATQIAGAQKTLGIIYFYKGEIDTAFSYFNQSKDTYEESGDISGVARSYNNMGILYKNTGQIKEAQENYLSAIEAFKKTDDTEGVALSYLNIGNLYSSQGDYKSALDNLLSGLKYFEQTDNALKIAETYSNIGIIYGSQNNYDQALENFEKALKIYESAENLDRQSDSYNNIGTIYLEQNQLNKALEYFERSRDLCLKVGQPAKIAKAYYNLGDLNNKLKDYTKAVNYFNESLKIQVELENTLGVAECYTGLGEYYFYMKDYPKAIKNLEKAKKLAAGKDLLIQKEAAEWLSKSYAAKGDYKNAFVNHENFKLLNDSIFNENNKRDITQLSMQYEFDKQKSEIEKQQKLTEFEHQAQKRRAQNIGFILMLGIFALIIIAGILIRSSRIKTRANKLLAEQKNEIETKNVELQQKNEEILAISEQLSDTNIEVTKQRDISMKRQKEITDSIVYAQRIQDAVMPGEELFKNSVDDYFILFKPRDIVSGDFYWMAAPDDKVIIVAADCTGHGVPGAFMSMLGITMLNEIVSQHNILQAGEILNQLRDRVITALHQTGRENEAKDGMDISLCIIDKKRKKLEFAGAYNPLYHISKDKTLNEIKADRQPIGIFIKQGNSFTSNEVKYQNGDSIYLFSDGYVDQFGGDRNQKLKAFRFREHLIKNAALPMQEQKKELTEYLQSWQQDERQVDDILVIGVRL